MKFLGFLGPNGAGKTTTMRMLLVLLGLLMEKFIIKNSNLLDNLEYCRKFIGYVPEGSPLYQEMNAIDFLNFPEKLDI